MDAPVSLTRSGPALLVWGQARAQFDRLMAHRTLRQGIRFAIGGGVVTLISTGLYLAGALWANLSADLANLAAYLISVVIGYFIHRHWSFAEAGVDHGGWHKAARFFAGSLSSLALNAFFAFALVDRAGLSKAWPSLTMVFVTPVVVFWINKKWVFRS